MKDDKDLIDQIAKDMAFYDSLGRALDVAVIMGAHRDAAKTVIKLVRQHDRKRLREAVHSAERYDTHLFNEKEVLAIIDEVYKVEKPQSEDQGLGA